MCLADTGDPVVDRDRGTSRRQGKQEGICLLLLNIRGQPHSFPVLSPVTMSDTAATLQLCRLRCSLRRPQSLSFPFQLCILPLPVLSVTSIRFRSWWKARVMQRSEYSEGAYSEGVNHIPNHTPKESNQHTDHVSPDA